MLTAVGARITILGSGSAGNCAFLETPRLRLLIDAGFSGKQIIARLASALRVRTLHATVLRRIDTLQDWDAALQNLASTRLSTKAF